MYESVFQLRERPFCYAPRTSLYFPAAATEAGYQTLARCIQRAEGPGLLMGGPGTGKSLLCQRLAENFRDRFHVAMLNSAQLCTRRALLQNILFELGLPYRSLEEGELRLSLIDFLQPAETSREGLLMLVDEAHTLPLRLMEELRMLTNLVRDGQLRVRLVMAGGPILEERFANPKLECFNQRIAARCYLQPLNFDETCQYVRSQIAAVGGDPDQLFTEAALQAVYHAADGIPRLINQICDHALMLAAIGGHRSLAAAAIDEAWADIQQLPAPWQPGVREATADESVIEFGSLDQQPVLEVAPSEDSDPRLVVDDDDTEVVDLVEQLDDVQLHVAILEQDEAPATVAAPTPVAAATVVPTGNRTGPATVPSAIADPFAEDFEQEEIVIDRYAALEAASMWFEPTTQDEDLAPDSAPAAAENGTTDQAWPGRTKVLRVLPPDDHDLIVVVEDQRVGPPHANPAQRREYRQLFSRLRQS